MTMTSGCDLVHLRLQVGATDHPRGDLVARRDEAGLDERRPLGVLVDDHHAERGLHGAHASRCARTASAEMVSKGNATPLALRRGFTLCGDGVALPRF